MKSNKMISMILMIAIAMTSLAMLSTTLHAEAGQEGLAITVTADKASASLGTEIMYTYLVQNNTSDNVTGLSIKDSKFGVISLPRTTLVPSENVTATYVYKVIVADLPGPIVNTASVNGTDSEGTEIAVVSDQVSVALTVNKATMTKAEILILSGVHGNGLDKAPGLQKYFNVNSKAADHAGKKSKDDEDSGKGKQKGKKSDTNNDN